MSRKIGTSREHLLAELARVSIFARSGARRARGHVVCSVAQEWSSIWEGSLLKDREDLGGIQMSHGARVLGYSRRRGRGEDGADGVRWALLVRILVFNACF